MKSSNILRGSLLAFTASYAAAQQPSYQSIPYLAIKGQHFFFSNNGSEFFVRGAAYQQGIRSNGTTGHIDQEKFMDPLADATACQRDIPNLKTLGINAIRTYSIDPAQNHDDCMSMLADAGIYVISDLSDPDTLINGDTPRWNVLIYQRYIEVIDALSKYNNVMGFFAGDEVSNDGNTTAAAAYVKAAVRDSKAYIQGQKYHPMGIGYATSDMPISGHLADYFNCGDSSETVDFFGDNVNTCSGDFSEPEYFKNSPVPVFVAEYGCNTNQKRAIGDGPSILGSPTPLEGTSSGGILYDYFQEDNNHGLVSLGSDNSATPLQGFSDYATQLASFTPSGVNSNEYSPTSSPTACPPFVGTVANPTDENSLFLATATPLPPAPNAALCACEMSQLQCISTSNDDTTYQSDLDYVCGEAPGICDGIQSNFTFGPPGAYGMCSDQQKLSYAMNKYYQAQQGDSKKSACDFKGRATTQSTSAPSGTCASLLQAAGTDGHGTVPSPTGNAAQQAADAGGNVGAVGNKGSSSSGVGAAITVPALDLGMLQLGVYVVVALATGAGMIVL